MTFSKPGYQTWTQDITPIGGLGSCPYSPDCFVLDPNPRATLHHAAFEKPSAPSESRAQLQVFIYGVPSYGARISVTQATVRSPGIDTFEQMTLYPSEGEYGILPVDLPKVTAPTTVEYVLFYGGERTSAFIEVVPRTLVIRSLSGGVLSPATTELCSVTLRTGPAPAGGAVVSLTSSDPDVFSVPASVTVPAGQWTVDFPITGTGLVFNVPNPSKGTLRASWAGGWEEKSVSVYRPDVSFVAVSSSAIVGGSQATGTVGLRGPAYPTGQTIVTLESTLSSITIPPTVTIAPGASTATFLIATTPVTQPTTGTIRARLTTLADHQVSNPQQHTADLLLTLSGLALVCTPTEFAGGYSVSCQVSLPGSPAPAGGTVISLTSSSGVVSVPASVTVPEGQFAKTFSVTTTPTVSTTTSVLRATLGAEVAEVVLTVRQPTLTSLDSTTTVEGGSPISAYVRLDGPAPAGGVLVQLSSSSTSVTLPTSVLIPQGSSSESIQMTTAPVAALTEVVLSASSGSATVTRTITLEPQTWRLSPLAPGRVVAGASGVTLYGREFLPSNSVYLAGPVYSATAPDAPLCDEPAGACPGLDVQGVVPITPPQPSANRIVFTVPASLSPGYYTVRAKSAVGTLSSEARWLLIDDPSPVVPALAPEQHGLARPITSGQTVTGTFVENGDTSGATNDFNLYYFVAAAGTRVSVRLERADASLPWEHPDSLDPQVALIAPDGFVYENEGRQDVVPATDLNAEVTDLTLPQTGMWLIAASTSRGHGDYRLSYTMTAPGSVPLAQRIVPFTGRGTTAQVGTDVRLTLAAMDPRGYLLSGAAVTYTASYPDPGMGTVVWPDSQGTFTAVDGLAQVRLRSTTRGVVDIGTNLSDINGIITASSPDPVAEALVETTLATLPRYQPLEHHPYVVRDVDPDGNVTLDLGPVKTFESSRPSRPRTEWKSGPGGVKTLGALPAPDKHEPAPAPRPLPPTESLVAPACTALTPYRHVGVEAPELKTPYTVTLKDVSDGKPPEGVPIGEKGIEGYRIEKNVKLLLDVRDREGNPPPHPVLVRLAVGGPRSGLLLIGAEGAQQWCKEAFVVWHEADSQGNPGPDPVAFEYRLGTLSLLPGVEPDPDHPGQVKPVWGVAEVLEATTEAVTPEATTLDQTVFAVRPEPGKPQSLVDWDGPPEDDRWEWWNSFHTYYDPAHQARAVWVTNYNAYTLVDKFGNTVWGCRDTRTMHGGSRLTVNLPYQETTGPDFRAYALEMKWWADSSDQMPEGVTSVGLFVSYPESPGEWAAGEVSKSTLIDRQGGSQTHLKSYGGYEARFGMDDGAFPMSVSPEAKEAAIPRVGPGPAWAPSRSLDSPRRLALVLLTGREAPSVQEVFRAVHHPWEWTGGTWVERPVQPAQDPKIDVASKPKLRMKLVDVNGNVQTAAGFKVHLCPRFDHEGSPQAPEWPCPTAPVQSTNGVIEDLAMNPGVVGSGDPPSPDATGYLGLELTQAPTAPGTYYVYVESLDKDVKVRDQTLLHLDDTPEGQYQGGFALCTVEGGEFLDRDFRRLDPTIVREATPAVLRTIEPGVSAPTATYAVSAFDSANIEVGSPVEVTATRVGRSSAFLGYLTLAPRTSAGLLSGRLTAQAADEGPLRTLPGGKSKLLAERQGSQKARKDPFVPFRFAMEFCDPQGAASATQYTAIDDKYGNYAEKTFLRITVLDPTESNRLVDDAEIKSVHLLEIPSTVARPSVVFNGPANPSGINARDNNWDNGGDVILSAGCNPEEAPSLGVDIVHGVSEGRRNEPENAFFVRAVARARTNEAGQSLIGFKAELKVDKAVLPDGTPVDESEPLSVEMWVDQEDFFPGGSTPGRHPSRPGNLKTSIDWLEKHAFDALGSPLTPGEEEAFPTVREVLSDAYSPVNPSVVAYIGPASVSCPYSASSGGPVYHVVHFNAFATGLRWGMTAESADLTEQTFERTDKWSGVSWSIPGAPLAFFDQALSHEARHSLQYAVGIDTSGGNDGDRDLFVQGLSAGGRTLIDGRLLVDGSLDAAGSGGSDSNPGFDLYGNDTDPRAIEADCLSWKPALERDAFLRQRNIAGIAFGSAGVELADDSPQTMITGEKRTFLFPSVVRRPDLNLKGYNGRATVTAGSCVLSDGFLRTGGDVVIRVGNDGNYRLDVTAQGAPGTCTVLVRAFIPTDGTGSPVLPSDDAHSATLTIAVRSPSN